jgi:PQQ-like domain
MRFILLAGALAALAGSAPAAADSTVLTYHGALDRSGRYVMPDLTYGRARGLRPDFSFDASYRGEVYAQPLLWRDPKTGAGELIVATEEDEVYAFDEKTGAQIWMRTLGEPVRNAASAGFRCGDIWPLGVTGTPVIDKARAALYLDAMVMLDSHARHEIYAVSLADGSVEPGWPVDVTAALGGNFNPTVQNQRGALALFGGRVFVPYSGLAGDCGDYHGKVLGLSTSEPGRVVSFSTRARAGGIWAQGGVTSDGKSLFAATGNTGPPGNGATAKRCCASVQTSPAPSPSATISPRRTGKISTPMISILAAPRPFPSTSPAPRASGG